MIIAAIYILKVFVVFYFQDKLIFIRHHRNSIIFASWISFSLLFKFLTLFRKFCCVFHFLSFFVEFLSFFFEPFSSTSESNARNVWTWTDASWIWAMIIHIHLQRCWLRFNDSIIKNKITAKSSSRNHHKTVIKRCEIEKTRSIQVKNSFANYNLIQFFYLELLIQEGKFSKTAYSIKSRR